TKNAKEKNTTRASSLIGYSTKTPKKGFTRLNQRIFPTNTSTQRTLKKSTKKPVAYNTANTHTPNCTDKGVSKNVETNQAMLKDPAILVSTNCANKPTPIATAPLARFSGFKNNTLPPYSPSLLGVKE